MRSSQMLRSTSAAPSADHLLLDRRSFIGTVGSALAITFLPTLAPALASAGPEGWTVLRIIEGEIEVNGNKGKAYAIQQADGTAAYVGTKGQRFKVVLQNQTREPVAIHWHGIRLPNGQDGVPYVTQAAIKPEEERRYDFAIVQAGTSWLHSHFGCKSKG
jgi:FtsP/CotA-like multicopper oxidase with cupredoxin domain